MSNSKDAGSMYATEIVNRALAALSQRNAYAVMPKLAGNGEYKVPEKFAEAYLAQMQEQPFNMDRASAVRPDLNRYIITWTVRDITGKDYSYRMEFDKDDDMAPTDFYDQIAQNEFRELAKREGVILV